MKTLGTESTMHQPAWTDSSEAAERLSQPSRQSHYMMALEPGLEKESECQSYHEGMKDKSNRFRVNQKELNMMLRSGV